MSLLRPQGSVSVREISTRWSLLHEIDDREAGDFAARWERLLSRYEAAMVSFARGAVQAFLADCR